MDAFTPQQTIELVSRIGTKKAHMRLDKLWWNSFMAGPLLGFGCAVLVSTNASPWYQENAPGLIRVSLREGLRKALRYVKLTLQRLDFGSFGIPRRSVLLLTRKSHQNDDQQAEICG